MLPIIITAVLLFVVASRFVYIKYIKHIIYLKISKHLDRKLNSIYKKSVNEAIDKFWPELSLKERTDFVQYCGMNIGTSWNEGILTADDIEEIRSEVKKNKGRMEKLDSNDNI